jgi:hypothetical protein
MKRLLLILLACVVLPVWAGLPINPAVTPATLRSTICVPGYTKTIRPKTGYTNGIKRQEMQALGMPWSRASEFELDHHIPLTLGGAPADPANLWLQSWASSAAGYHGETDARLKDKLEVRLNHEVCSGHLKLDEAQACIWKDWRACLARFPANH